MKQIYIILKKYVSKILFHSKYINVLCFKKLLAFTIRFIIKKMLIIYSVEVKVEYSTVLFAKSFIDYIENIENIEYIEFFKRFNSSK